MNKSRKVITFREDADMPKLLESHNIKPAAQMKLLHNYNIALVEITNDEFANLLMDSNVVSIEPEKISHVS